MDSLALRLRETRYKQSRPWFSKYEAWARRHTQRRPIYDVMRRRLDA